MYKHLCFLKCCIQDNQLSNVHFNTDPYSISSTKRIELSMSRITRHVFIASSNVRSSQTMVTPTRPLNVSTAVNVHSQILRPDSRWHNSSIFVFPWECWQNTCVFSMLGNIKSKPDQLDNGLRINCTSLSRLEFCCRVEGFAQPHIARL